MNKYINPDLLIQDVEQSMKGNCHIADMAVLTHRAEHIHFLKMILDQPAANVVEVDADFAKVTRCKHCKHSRPIDKTKSPEKYYRDDCIICKCEDVVGDEPMIYLDSHFCSYGERQ